MIEDSLGCCKSLFPSMYGDCIRVDSTCVYYVPKSRPTILLKEIKGSVALCQVYTLIVLQSKCNNHISTITLLVFYDIKTRRLSVV